MTEQRKKHVKTLALLLLFVCWSVLFWMCCEEDRRGQEAAAGAYVKTVWRETRALEGYRAPRAMRRLILLSCEDARELEKRRAGVSKVEVYND